MFGHAVEILDTEPFPETQDPVGKNNIHRITSLRAGIRRMPTVVARGRPRHGGAYRGKAPNATGSSIAARVKEVRLKRGFGKVSAALQSPCVGAPDYFKMLGIPLTQGQTFCVSALPASSQSARNMLQLAWGVTFAFAALV